MHWIVVGAGAAGCALTSRLLAAPDDHVLLVEAGPGLDHSSGRLSGSRSLDVGPQPRHEVFVRPHTAVTRRLGESPSHYSQGWGLGGSSLINGGVVTGEVPPSLVGVMPLEPPHEFGVVAAALLAADAGTTAVQLVRHQGLRVTAFDVFLGSAAAIADDARLTAVANTEVTRLLVDGRRVLGVRTANGDEFTADAVVLCAGAIETPTLLLRSGLDTPGIGEGVQDHPGVRVAFDLDPEQFDPTVPAIGASLHRGAHQVFALDHVRPDLPLGVLMAGLMRVASRGVVSLPDPDGPPLVSFGMLEARGDAEGLVAAGHDLVDIVQRPAFREAVGQVYVDDHGTTLHTLMADGDFDRWVQRGELGGFHHVAASCRRGVVTDAEGWVQGYEGLAIGDASLFDDTPVRDPYIAVVDQALRLVTPRFLARHRP